VPAVQISSSQDDLLSDFFLLIQFPLFQICAGWFDRLRCAHHTRNLRSWQLDERIGDHLVGASTLRSATVGLKVREEVPAEPTIRAGRACQGH